MANSIASKKHSSHWEIINKVSIERKVSQSFKSNQPKTLIIPLQQAPFNLINYSNVWCSL